MRVKPQVGYFSFNIFPSHYAHSVNIMKMCQAFQRNGYATTLFACPNDKATATDEDLLFSHYGISDRFLIQWVDIASRKWIFRWRIFYNTLLACKKFDFCYTRNFIAAFACHIMRKPCFFELHTPDFPKIGKVIMSILMQSKQMRFVAISKELTQLLGAKYKVPIEKFKIEHDAYDPQANEFEPAYTKLISYNFTRQRLKAMYIGSFYPGRGIDMIIRLAEKNPDVDFIAIGGKSQETNFNSSQANLSNLFLYKRISHSQVHSLLVKADILLMPYGYLVTIEGKGNTAKFSSPLKLFEYLGAGKPIIASKLPSFCEILRNQENSLLVDAESFGSWHNALRHLKENMDLRARLATNALLTAKKHTWDKRVKRIMKHYSSERE